ncbi:MAG: hypothetical protein KatS3mg072_0468 [Meiothermus sp.]|nr:MAG: hypothetical protein KatS3mg072_0468 [Meiothermus sp.]
MQMGADEGFSPKPAPPLCCCFLLFFTNISFYASPISGELRALKRKLVRQHPLFVSFDPLNQLVQGVATKLFQVGLGQHDAHQRF